MVKNVSLKKIKIVSMSKLYLYTLIFGDLEIWK